MRQKCKSPLKFIDTVRQNRNSPPNTLFGTLEILTFEMVGFRKAEPRCGTNCVPCLYNGYLKLILRTEAIGKSAHKYFDTAG